MPHTDDDRVRDHLSNERTYLSWLRTGISMMGFGIVIAKLRYLFLGADAPLPSVGMIHASNIGILFSVIGLFVVIVSGWRFIVVQNQIRKKSYRSTRAAVVVLSTVVTVLGIFVVCYLLQDTILHAL